MSQRKLMSDDYEEDAEQNVLDDPALFFRGEKMREQQLRAAAVRANAREASRLTGLAADAILADRAQDEKGVYSIYQIAGRYIPRWHFAMLNDQERNNAFAMAIEQVICAGDYVLDIGAGSGLLAMMAVRAGAGKVTSCEENPLLAEIARQVVEINGMSDRITIIAKHSSELCVGVDIEQRVDVVMSEIMDCGLIGEGLLSTVRHARDHLLAEGGTLLPRSGRLSGYLISSAAAACLNKIDLAAGFDVSLFNRIATPGHFPIRLKYWPHEVMSETVELMSCDLATDSLDDSGCRLIHIPIIATGTAHALVAWFDLDLGFGVRIRNSPENVRSHWHQAIISFDSPIHVTRGQDAVVCLSWRDSWLNAELVLDSCV